MPPSDTELMLAFRTGDREAFQGLVERYAKPLIAFFHRLTWDRETSEDLAQEVFLHLYRFKGRYTVKAKFSTFLFTIARNCYRDHNRRVRRRLHPVSLDARSLSSDDETSLGDRIPVEEPPPEATAVRNETMTRLRRAIEALTPDLRMVFVLCEENGLSYAEVAEVMEIPIGTVKSRLFTATRKLRDRLGTGA
ncbi:MAG: sigma-70 family RNA polymerase sigma factor [Planctomycetota bacterium]